MAVEFALLALPFFTIIAAILETALVFLAGQILESAVHDSSRLLRTGQAQNAEFDADDYRAAICDGLYGLFDCNSGRMRVKVEVLDGFSDASAAISPPVSSACSTDPDACDWTTAETFDAGVGSDIVVVQTYYKWPTLVDLPWFNLADQAGGDRLLSGIRVFRNEPF
ncbi:MAG TPA: TadE/TadG family type IV pilus assembly protein [Devosiaceae bacterium]|nr:TadE/TadG family type IV pilus assembly protein [Devosiaceae bacterium]